MKNLRLLMPLWQGGNNPYYYTGAKILSKLMPPQKNTFEVEVPIEEFNTELTKEDGIVARSTLINQLNATSKIIETYNPEKIITIGGDCLISQAPFAYLSEKYENLGVLWIDAHPDISTKEIYQNAHAMVLGNLLGHGDEEFSSLVKNPIPTKNIMYAGLQKMLPKEVEIYNQLNLHDAGDVDVLNDNVLLWLKENNITKLAIHFDFDVLDPNLFKSLTFTRPGYDYNTDPASKGVLTLDSVSNLINNVANNSDVVGFSFAEYIPWDTINLINFLENLAIFK